MLLGEVIHGDYNTWVGPTKGLLHSGTNYQVKYRSNTGQILVKSSWIRGRTGRAGAGSRSARAPARRRRCAVCVWMCVCARARARVHVCVWCPRWGPRDIVCL